MLPVARSVRLYEFLVQVRNVDVLDESGPSWASGRYWKWIRVAHERLDPIQIFDKKKQLRNCFCISFKNRYLFNLKCVTNVTFHDSNRVVIYNRKEKENSLKIYLFLIIISLEFNLTTI